ncbi:hypothetical protein CALVIDRAFT_567138 [Calocera viscosa TUFC12733]|uniref:Trafficking protein particle complex II-specific subunit 65 IgD3 domain-containing protein n=1 Tax=Calocera viscosa (strain TUFC12733) TaxID=1330018 RepID=A0A167IHH3_CALVF|nr:hypothetical protein CALVIDRAFT_567138 [Calocera viscosa TUFC12733]
MSTIEQLFGRATVDILIPTAPFSLKDVGDDYGAWTERVSGDARKLAFYGILDEHLPLVLSLKLPLSSASSAQDADPTSPPASVLNLLARTQLTLEASYIASTPYPSTPLTPGPPSARPTSALPGRSASLRPGQQTLPVSMQPPQTPVPTPGTMDWDRKYSRAEGVVMGTFVWGEDANGEAEEQGEKFALLWGEREKAWTALFRMDVTIAYLRTRTPDPLLCLTCSATLRDKPLLPTAARAPLLSLIQSANINVAPDVPQTPNTANSVITTEFDDDDEDDDIARFEEVNLLDGLVGPSYSSMTESEDAEDQLTLPSTRLSHTLRRELFSLPTLASPPSSAVPTTGTPTPAPTPMMAHNRARSVPAIMRKAFRKVLPVVSGIKVRMRASFLPRSGLMDEEDEGEEESQGKRCVLSVEVENAGDGYGFEVERIELNVSGDDSRTSLIGWDPESDEHVFPLRLKAQDQYNLLYNVAFTSWNASSGRAPPAANGSKRISQLSGQRNVIITLHGRPFSPTPSTPTPARPQVNGHKHGEVEYVTESFPSTWNCTIDITPTVADADLAAAARTLGDGEVLPTPHPTSPFRSTLPPGSNMLHHHLSPIASPIAAKRAPGTDKRATFANLTTLQASPRLPSTLSSRPTGPARSATLPALSALNTSISSASVGPPKFTPTKPSSMMSVIGPNGVTVMVPSPGRPSVGPSSAQPNRRSDPPPPTPAFPPYSAVSRPKTPMSQLPAAAPANGTGATVEPRRNRVSFPAAASPGPNLPGPPPTAALEGMRVESEPVLVSVALQYPQRGKGRVVDEDDKANIEPLDTFSLEIFVFNQSSTTRTLVVSYPTSRARSGSVSARDRQEDTEKLQKDRSGFLPLENQKTIGPLLPGTCQSIQMPFLALQTGVHTIDTLELHDPDTGYTLNLRQVMTVVVRDALPNGGEKVAPNGA